MIKRYERQNLIKIVFRNFVWGGLLSLIAGYPLPAYSQAGNSKVNVNLSVVSQKWITNPDLEAKEPLQVINPIQDNAVDILGGYSDVIVVGKGDDLLVRFRLTNNEPKPIYYIAENYNCHLTGYLLFRKKKAKEWNAISPAYGRESSLTGGAFEWMTLLPGESVETEFSDLSSREHEHAISVFVNIKPTQKGRIEIISDVYHPLQH